METGQDDKRKVPQSPTRRVAGGTGRRTIGEWARHTIHLEKEEVSRIKKTFLFKDCGLQIILERYSLIKLIR